LPCHSDKVFQVRPKKKIDLIYFMAGKMVVGENPNKGEKSFYLLSNQSLQIIYSFLAIARSNNRMSCW
jgi:hypothetical protein